MRLILSFQTRISIEFVSTIHPSSTNLLTRSLFDRGDRNTVIIQAVSKSDYLFCEITGIKKILKRHENIYVYKDTLYLTELFIHFCVILLCIDL